MVSPFKDKFVVTPPSILNYVEVTFIKKFITAINKEIKLIKEKRFDSSLNHYGSIMLLKPRGSSWPSSVRLRAVTVENEKTSNKEDDEADQGIN